jgi:hypothetical protein
VVACSLVQVYRHFEGTYQLPQEMRTSSIDLAQLSRFYLKTDTESSLRNDVFSNMKRTVV